MEGMTGVSKQNTDLPATSGVLYAYQSVSGTATKNIQSKFWDCEPGQEFLVEVWLKASVANSRMYIELRDQTGAHGTTIQPTGVAGDNFAGVAAGLYPVENFILPTTWTKYTCIATATSIAKQLRVGSIYFNHANGSVTTAIQNFAIRIRPRASGQLVVDGSITALKIATNAVDTTKLVAGSITTEKLAIGVMGSNLVPNPSFEDVSPFAVSPIAIPPYTAAGATGWQFTSTGSGSITATITNNGRARSGNWSASIDINSTPTTPTGYLWSAPIPLVPGKIYKVSVSAAATTADASMLVQIALGTTADNVPTNAATLNRDDDFVDPTLFPAVQASDPLDPSLFSTFTFDFTAPASYNYGRLKIWGYSQTANTTTRLVIDDVSLVEKAPGGASELTSAGLRLFDSEGLEVGAFISNRPNYFSVAQGGTVVASISTTGDTMVNNLDVTNKDISIGGSPLLGRGLDRFGMREVNTSAGWDAGRDYEVEPVGVAEAMSGANAGYYGAANVPSTTLNAAGALVQLGQMNCDLSPGRLYAFMTSPYLAIIPTGAVVALIIRWTSNGTDPTTASPIFARAYTTGSGNYESFQIGYRAIAGTGSQTDVRFLAVVQYLTGTGTVTPVADPFYMTCLDTGYGAPPASGTIINATTQAAGSPPATTTTKTYVSSWIASNSHTRRGTSSFGNNTINPTSYTGSTSMLAGYYSSSNGNQYSFIEFASANSTGSETNKSISTALSGATLTKVELYVKNTSFYSSSGGSQRFAATNFTSIPTGTAVAPPAVTYTGNQAFTTGQGKWITLPSAAITAIKTNGGRVVILGPGTSTSQSYYSKWNNHVSSSKPQLRLTYTK
jgi:hypothetical protein